MTQEQDILMYTREELEDFKKHFDALFARMGDDWKASIDLHMVGWDVRFRPVSGRRAHSADYYAPYAQVTSPGFVSQLLDQLVSLMREQSNDKKT